MTSTTEVKKALRKQIRAAKNAVPFCEKLSRSETLMAQVENLEQFQNAHTVLLYWSMDDEVQTHDFVNRWYKEKRLLLPCVDGDDLRLRQYTGPEQWPSSRWGVAVVSTTGCSPPHPMPSRWV